MVQTHDVMIDGAGYMIVPGTYRYEVKGADVRTVRTGVPSFETALGVGAGGPDVIDRDTVRWSAAGMMPLPIGLGSEAGRLVLAPAESALNLALGVNWDGNSHSIVFGGKVYVSLGANLFSVNVNGSGQMTGVTFIGAAAGAITSMAVVNGVLLMGCAAPATTMSNYSGSGVIANTPAAKAAIVWQYASGIWRSKADAPDTIAGSIDGGATWTQWELDSAVRSVVAWHGRATGGGVMLIATGGMLWELSGQWAGSPAAFSGTVSPIYQATGGGDGFDFGFMAEYQGHIFTWYAGTVHRWDGVALLPVPGGPRGTCFGLCVAGGYLCVSATDNQLNALWAFDGVRWFMLQRGAAAVASNLNGTAGLITDGHLLSLNIGAQTVSRWALPVQGFTTAPRASGLVVVGPLDAGAGDAIKTWTQVSAAWSTALFTAQASAPASPPGGALLLEYSVDDGSTWTAVGTTTLGIGARSGLAVQPVPNVEGQRLSVRVTLTPTSAYAAYQLNAVYASGWQIGDIPHDERWALDLKMTDKLVKRDGSIDVRSGETMLQAIRSLAQSGRTFVFQDIDFDLNARSVTGRVVGLKEQTRKGDGTHFLESQISLIVAAVA